MNFIWLCFLSIFISACGTSTLKLSELNYLRKGMSFTSVDSVISMKEVSTFKLGHGQKFVVKAYPIYTDQVSSHIRRLDGVSGQETIPLSTNIYLIFSNEELRYWGVIQELRKSEDAEIREMSRFIFPN